MVYYKRTCLTIQNICEGAAGTWKGFNGTHCENTVTSELVSIGKVVKRTLASEEYYKYFNFEPTFFLDFQ